MGQGMSGELAPAGPTKPCPPAALYCNGGLGTKIPNPHPGPSAYETAVFHVGGSGIADSIVIDPDNGHIDTLYNQPLPFTSKTYTISKNFSSSRSTSPGTTRAAPSAARSTSPAMTSSTTRPTPTASTPTPDESGTPPEPCPCAKWNATVDLAADDRLGGQARSFPVPKRPPRRWPVPGTASGPTAPRASTPTLPATTTGCWGEVVVVPARSCSRSGFRRRARVGLPWLAGR